MIRGANISINFSDDGISREEAEQRVRDFALLFNKPYYHQSNDNRTYNWFVLEQLEGDEAEEEFELTVFHN